MYDTSSFLIMDDGIKYEYGRFKEDSGFLCQFQILPLVF